MTSNLSAQPTYQFGTLPSLNLNTSLSEDWKLNFQWQSRQSILRGRFDESPNYQVRYQLSDFTILGARKISLNQSIAMGALLRFREGDVIFRSIQQFAIIQRLEHFRMAHRFAADQTFQEEESITFRLRYRIGAEFALSGEKVDRGELYLKINHEYLNAFQDTDYDLEIRLIPLLGYVFSDNNKLEAGLDYRINSFINGSSRNTLWFSMNWFVKL